SRKSLTKSSWSHGGQARKRSAPHDPLHSDPGLHMTVRIAIDRSPVPGTEGAHPCYSPCDSCPVSFGRGTAPSQQVAQSPPDTALAFFLVFAPVARCVERVLRHRAPVDLPELVQGRDHLPAVPGLDHMVPGDAIRDIFHETTLNLLPGHLLKAECDGSNPQPVGCIGTHRHRTRRPHNGECAAVINAVDHPCHPVFLRCHSHVCLDCRSPCGFVAGSDAEIQKLPHIGIDC